SNRLWRMVSRLLTRAAPLALEILLPVLFQLLDQIGDQLVNAKAREVAVRSVPELLQRPRPPLFVLARLYQQIEFVRRLDQSRFNAHAMFVIDPELQIRLAQIPQLREDLLGDAFVGGLDRSLAEIAFDRARQIARARFRQVMQQSHSEQPFDVDLDAARARAISQQHRDRRDAERM